MASERKGSKKEVGFDPLAGVLALVLPGGGHVMRGDLRRGVLIGVGVLGLFFGGLLIGGLSVIDRTSPRTETRLSFIGQAWVGPLAFAADVIHQTRFKVPASPGSSARRTPRPDESPAYTPSLGKANEIGVLYTLLAGMLNFIAFLDALLPPLSRSEHDEVRTSGALDAVIGGGS